jgi:L-lactate dehydrogenase (cytochrome)
LPASEEPVERISLSEIVGLPDFDAAAKQNLTPKAWAYMSAGGTDEYSKWLLRKPTKNPFVGQRLRVPTTALGLNRSSFNQILFRPRILVDVDVVDTRTQMMGQETTLPVS